MRTDSDALPFHESQRWAVLAFKCFTVHHASPVYPPSYRSHLLAISLAVFRLGHRYRTKQYYWDDLLAACTLTSDVGLFLSVWAWPLYIPVRGYPKNGLCLLAGLIERWDHREVMLSPNGSQCVSGIRDFCYHASLGTFGSVTALSPLIYIFYGSPGRLALVSIYRMMRWESIASPLSFAYSFLYG